MKILIDIGHPGHVHYFKNLYLNLERKGHEILFTARDKEVTFELLRHYKMPYISRGRGKKSVYGKLIYLLYASFLIVRSGFKFKPDIIISFASPYASLAAFILRCANIILDDTEAGRFERYIYKPLADLIITPKVFKEILGPKQFRFDGFMELAYLWPSYFKPDPKIPESMGIAGSEKYIIIRFVSWEASHDKGQTGLSLQQKYEIINLCRGKFRIFISSERELPESLERFRLKIDPHQLHDALYYASVYIGEGATTATEACILGTPAVYINTLSAGTIEEEVRVGILYSFRNFEGVTEKITEIINEENKNRYLSLSQTMIRNKIDLTSFLTWLVEEYPQSLEVINDDPDYQYNFK